MLPNKARRKTWLDKNHGKIVFFFGVTLDRLERTGIAPHQNLEDHPASTNWEEVLFWGNEDTLV